MAFSFVIIMDAKYDRKIEFQKINISTFPKYQGSCLFLISTVSSRLFFVSLPQTNPNRIAQKSEGNSYSWKLLWWILCCKYFCQNSISFTQTGYFIKELNLNLQDCFLPFGSLLAASGFYSNFPFILVFFLKTPLISFNIQHWNCNCFDNW